MGLLRFTPVTAITDPLNLAIGIAGASGTGKTYTSLLIARGIAEVMTGGKGARIGYIDTENKRALHYKGAFPEMVHMDFSAVDEAGEMLGFGPERWIEAIDVADAEGLPVVILDSASHSWEGVGGILDMQAQELERLVAEAEAKANGRYAVDHAKFSEQAWIRPKARYRRLIDRIVRAKCNVIICNRAKPVRQAGFGDKAKNARPTKLRRDDVPWDIAGDSSMVFEMTVSVILDPSAPGCPVHQIKVADQFKGLFDPRRPMGVDTGRAMAEWARGQGAAEREKAAMDAARAVARGGTEAMRKWCKANPDTWAIARPITQELQRIAAAADAAAVEDDDPFGLPPITDAQRAEAEAAAMAEIAARDAQEEAA